MDPSPEDMRTSDFRLITARTPREVVTQLSFKPPAGLTPHTLALAFVALKWKGEARTLITRIRLTLYFTYTFLVHFIVNEHIIFLKIFGEQNEESFCSIYLSI